MPSTLIYISRSSFMARNLTHFIAGIMGLLSAGFALGQAPASGLAATLGGPPRSGGGRRHAAGDPVRPAWYVPSPGSETTGSPAVGRRTAAWSHRWPADCGAEGSPASYRPFAVAGRDRRYPKRYIAEIAHGQSIGRGRAGSVRLGDLVR